MLDLFILGYILPLIIMFSIVYFSDDILTVRDLLSWWWAYLTPVVNISVILILTIGLASEFVESKIDKNWWNNFLDGRL